LIKEIKCDVEKTWKVDLIEIAIFAQLALRPDQFHSQ